MVKRKFTFAHNPLLAGPALDEREQLGTPYRELELTSIDRDPQQPRKVFDEVRLKELAESIKTYGVLSPIFVRPSGTPGRYILIAGERRLRASELVGRKTIPALVDQEPVTTGDRTMAMQLVENLQRADLSPLERAHAIGALRDRFNLSIRDIAEKLGVSKSMVQRSLDILTLPDDLMAALREGAAESKVLLLAKIEDEEIRASYLRDLDVLTRGQLEKDVARRGQRGDGQGNQPSAEDSRIADEIQRSIGLKVRLVRNAPGGDSGKISIEFYSDSDLQEIFRKLVSQ